MACGSGAPVSVRVVGADDRDLFGGRRWRLGHGVGHTQVPTGVGADCLDSGARMVAAQECLARSAVEAEHRQVGYDRGGPTAREAYALAPPSAVSVARRGDEADASGQATAIMVDHNSAAM